MRGIAPIIVIVTTIGLIASIITIPSCHWVRLRGRNETNRNLGIWRHANEDDRGWLAGNCVSYGTYFDNNVEEIDGHLRFARWATIISPIFASICLFGNLSIAGTVLGGQLSLMGSLIAFIFQSLTLTVNFSNACNITPTSYCMVGITTWAYWLSLCSSICYLIALLLSCGQLSTIKEQESDNNNNNQHKPEQAVPVVNVDNNNNI